MPEQKLRPLVLTGMGCSGKVRRILRQVHNRTTSAQRIFHAGPPAPAPLRIGTEMPSKSSGSSKPKVSASAPGPSAKPKSRAAEAKADVKADVKPKKAAAKPAPAASPTNEAAIAASPKTPAARRPPAAAKASPGTAARVGKAASKKANYDKDSLGAIRKRLMEQREELQNQLTAIEESATGLSQSEMSGEVSYDEDFADAGSFTFEREKEFSIANNVTDLRSKIDRALHQIEEGSYGICESCGQPIEGPRLKALPHVTLCLKCKKAEERR